MQSLLLVICTSVLTVSCHIEFDIITVLYKKRIPDTVQPFLAVYDFLTMAETAANQSDNIDAIRQGLMMIIAEYRKAFEELSLKPFNAVGEKFDPSLHDAVAHESSDEIEEGVVSKQWNCGFKLGEKVLRAARVVVSSGAPKEEDKKEE